MTRPQRKRVTTLALLILATVNTLADDDVLNDDVDDVIQSARSYSPAIVIERTAPKYPRLELNRGHEAWVHVTYCIDESGQTRNVSVVDSTGGRHFDDAAIETVEDWQFEPAMLDGEPSWQSRNQTYITFAIESDERGASRRFVRAFRKLGNYMDEKNLEEADALFQNVLANYDLSLYELSKLWAQRVRYEGLRGDMRGMDEALHRATASKGQWIERDEYIRLLKLRVQVEISIGQYNAALEGFEELEEQAGEDSEEVKTLLPSISQLRAYIDGDQAIRIQAEVRNRFGCDDCDSRWSFKPLRDSFALADVSGELSRVDMRCDHKRFESIVSDEVTWKIPERWGGCYVYFYGDAGTTFDVVMMSSANSP